MKSHRTGKFRALFDAMPSELQQHARKAYRLWCENPRHPSLHFKEVAPQIWSVRITLGVRALGFLRGENIYWHWIGPHDEYERLIQQYNG